MTGNCGPETELDYLQHLDESYTEVEVCLITADETAAVEDPDRNNGAHIGVEVHINILTVVQEACTSRQYLCDDSGENQMPACQDSRCSMVLLDKCLLDGRRARTEV